MIQNNSPIFVELHKRTWIYFLIYHFFDPTTPQYRYRNNANVSCLFYFVMLHCCSVLFGFSHYRVPSRAMGLTYERPNANVETLKKMSECNTSLHQKWNFNKNKTKQNRNKTVWISWVYTVCASMKRVIVALGHAILLIQHQASS